MAKYHNAVWSQNSDGSGNLVGVPGAMVTLHDYASRSSGPGTGTVLDSVLTDAYGNFTLDAPSEGLYDIKVVAGGYTAILDEVPIGGSGGGGSSIILPLPTDDVDYSGQTQTNYNIQATQQRAQNAVAISQRVTQADYDAGQSAQDADINSRVTYTDRGNDLSAQAARDSGQDAEINELDQNKIEFVGEYDPNRVYEKGQAVRFSEGVGIASGTTQATPDSGDPDWQLFHRGAAPLGNTDHLPEGPTNKYFTSERAVAALQAKNDAQDAAIAAAAANSVTIQRAKVTTAAGNGEQTFTFPVAFAAAPIVSASVVATNSARPINVEIVSVTAADVTVRTQRPEPEQVVVIGTVNITYEPVAADVHIVAVEP